MATATKSRKRSKKVKRHSGVDKPKLRSTAEITADLADARAKRQAIDVWDHSRIDAADSKVAALEQELAAAQLAEMPVPDPLALKTVETDVAIAEIVLTGNHREQLEEPAAIQRLARSLQIVGLQQRVGVRDMGKGKFELIFGSRRRLAALASGWPKIPAKVYPIDTTPEQVELLRDIENFNRKDLTPVERAIAVARTIDTVEKMSVPRTEDGRKLIAAVEAAGGRDAYVGQLLGYPADWVRDHAYVSKLGSVARELLAARRISIEIAREIAKVGDKAEVDNLAQMAARKIDGTGGENIGTVRKWITEKLRSLKSVPWRLDVPVKGKGSLSVACERCQFNTKSDPLLFEHDVNGDADVAGLTTAAGVCRNGACFSARQLIASVAIDEGLEKAAKAVKKSKGEIPLTEKGLADFIPASIRGATFARKAKATIDADTGAKEKITDGNGRHEAQPPKSPEQVAVDRFRESFSAWGNASAGKIVAKINEKPLRKVLIMLLAETGVLNQLEHNLPYLYGAPKEREKQLQAATDANAKARKLAQHGALKGLIGMLESPKLADIEGLAERGIKVEPQMINDLVDEALMGIAAAVGVELEPAPVLDAMLKEERDKAAPVKTDGKDDGES